MDILEENKFFVGNCLCVILKDIVFVKLSKELIDLSLYGIYYMLLDVKEELIIGRKILVLGCL